MSEAIKDGAQTAREGVAPMPTEDDWFRCGRYQEAQWWLDAANKGETVLSAEQRALCEKELAPGPPPGYLERDQYQKASHRGMSRGMETFDRELGVSLG